MMWAIVSSLFLLSSVTSASTAENFSASENVDWGFYYDPKNIFCGKYDCYKILGFDYENFGRTPPDKKDITKRYRSMSRTWHPDKNRQQGAQERFVKIARAYEVLTTEKTRKEYDNMRYDQDAYISKYGASILWQYAPKSDVTLVVILILGFGSLLSWFLQKQHWQSVADRLIRAAVEDLPLREGGTPESKELREKGLKILAEQEKANENGSSDDASTKKKKKKVKMTASEKRKQQEDALRPIVTKMVNEIDDFGAGYHKPTWRDLLVVKLAQVPATLYKGILWNVKYAYRRMRNLELNEEELEVLTRRAVGEVKWTAASDAVRAEMCEKKLWVAENMAEWEEEQERRLLSSADRKKYDRMKKKGKPQGNIEDWKED